MTSSVDRGQNPTMSFRTRRLLSGEKSYLSRYKISRRGETPEMTVRLMPLSIDLSVGARFPCPDQRPQVCSRNCVSAGSNGNKGWRNDAGERAEQTRFEVHYSLFDIGNSLRTSFLTWNEDTCFTATKRRKRAIGIPVGANSNSPQRVRRFVVSTFVTRYQNA